MINPGLVSIKVVMLGEKLKFYKLVVLEKKFSEWNALMTKEYVGKYM